ncbi:MAG: uroporphyrinogen decarboxylase [Nitrospirota bacterium]
MSRSDRFLLACQRKPTDCTPVWFMRQAGRYMKEYRAIRKKHSILTICKTPELAAQVTLQPIEQFDLDAAIIFADILLPLEPMGIELEFAKGEGPVIHNPVRDAAAVKALATFEPDEKTPFVMEAIRTVRRELNGKVPLIGFCGAPFTLASYMIEGGHSNNYIRTKQMMLHSPRVWKELMTKLAEMMASYLRAQIRAGAQAVQIFDSWAGCLSPDDYREYVMPYSRLTIAGLKKEGVPVIHFGTGTSGSLESLREAGGDVIGVDWRINLDDAWKRLGPDVAIQGNLDPVVLFGPVKEIERRVKDILKRAGGRPGHIFNLGHGILPETPVENVAAVIETVHTFNREMDEEDES